MWVRVESTSRRMLEAPSHPEVDQENATALEPNNQILSATLEGFDAFAFQLGRHLGRVVGSRQPRIEDLDALETAADEHRHQSTANRLDFRQFWHAASLARAAKPERPARSEEHTS